MEISVIVPLYNGVEVLHEALQSIKDQTYKQWKCIVGVNGHGPTGGSVYEQANKIVEDLRDARFHVVNIPDTKGAPQAVNALVGMCKTEWIAHCDADDKWHPYKLEYQVHVAQSHNVDVIGTWAQYFGDWDGAPEQPGGLLEVEIFKKLNPMIHSSIMIRKEYDHYTDEFFGIYDYDCWIRQVLNGAKFYNIPIRLTYHRLSNISVFNATGKQDPDTLRKHYFGH
jgi:glycosyltransferase involved in cell wall biosynthesis